MKPRKIDNTGLLLCKIQAETFELSQSKVDTSSELFIRRFQRSDIAKRFDDMSVIYSNLQPLDILYEIENQYGESSYGTVKYTEEELFWIGYMYRYFSYTYDMSSVQVYSIIKPKELKSLYYPYHTLDCSQAIERILEAKGIDRSEENDIKHQYEIYKRIRESATSV